MGKAGAKKQKKGEAGKKGKKAPPPKIAPPESSEEESSEEEVVQPTKVQKKAPAKPVKKAESSSSEEDSEEEVPQKKVKATPTKKVVQQDSEDDSDDDDDSSEEEAPPAKPAKAVKKVPQKKTETKKVVKQESDDEDESDDDDSSEEEAPPVKKAAKAGSKRPAQKDESSDDDDEDDEPAPKVAKNAKQNGKAQDTESSDDEEDDDSSEEEEEEEEEPVETKKRKKDKQSTEAPSPKKAKVEESENGDDGLTLFVGGVPKDASEDDVLEFFTEKKIKVTAVRKIPNRMTAFIDVKSAKDVAKASALTGADYNGLTLKVEKAKPKGEKKEQNNSFSSPAGGRQSFGGDDSESRTLFVKGLPDDATEDNVGEIFDTADQVRLPMKDGYHRGFCFVEFADANTMEAAMSAKQGADLNGSSLYLDYMGAKSTFKKRGGGGDRGSRGFDRGGRGGRGGRDFSSNQGARGESKTLFVKNLSYDTDESSIRQAFDGASSVRIPTFPDSGKPKGFAFVEFGSADQAASAHDAMFGAQLDGRQIRVDFAADRTSGGFGGGGGGGFRGRGGGGGRGFGGRGRGGDRGRGRGFGRGGGFPNKAKGGIVPSEGRKTTFGDSD